MKIVSRSLFGALALIVSTSPLAAANGPDVLVAHRGIADSFQVTYNIPENSIPAWDWAIKHCADIVDMDVQITYDGKFVVMHDATINRTTNRTGYVKDRTLAYIQAAYLELPVDRDGNGNDDNTPYHPPSLNQALDFLRDKTDCNGNPIKIAMEAKGSGWTQTKINSLASLLSSKGMLTSRVIGHAFSKTTVGYMKTAGFPNRGYVVPQGTALPSAATVKSYAQNVIVFVGDATPSKITEYNNAGLKVWLTTLTTSSDFKLAWSKGKVYAWVVNDLVGAQNYLRTVQ
jgi:glycerophosphoryl diester phosphodiesterase